MILNVQLPSTIPKSFQNGKWKLKIYKNPSINLCRHFIFVYIPVFSIINYN